MSLPPLTLNAWLRYDLVRRLLREMSGVRSILEIGPGRGAVGARLAHGYTYTGVESDPISAGTARERIEAAGGSLVHGTTRDIDGGGFDLACAFEVLEHIEDDRAALREWYRLLRPGGYLMLSVPAFQHRFAPADHVAGHFRRYDPDAMRELLAATGFADARVMLYGFPLGYALEWGRNMLARRSRKRGSMADRTGASGRWFQPPEWLGWATNAATFPFRVLQRAFTSGRLGTGLLVVAGRPR
jgi:SAM-dependent methyltransferase